MKERDPVCPNPILIMISTAPGAKTKQRLTATRGWLAAALLVAATGAGILAAHRLGAGSEQGKLDLHRATAAARMAGIALRPSDLSSIPPAQNAAPEYEKLVLLFRQRHLHDPLAALYGTLSREDLSSEDLHNLQGLLAQNRDLLALLRQATSRPACHFSRDWSLGPWMKFPEYPTFRDAARLLRLQAYALLRQERFLQAVEVEREALRLSSHAASDPLLMSYLLGQACRADALVGLKQVLALAPGRSDAAEAVEQTLRSNLPPLSLAHALSGEGLVLQVGIQAEVLGKRPGHLPPERSGGTALNLQAGLSADTDQTSEGAPEAEDSSLLARFLPPPRQRGSVPSWMAGMAAELQGQGLEELRQLKAAAALPYPDRLRKLERLEDAAKRDAARPTAGSILGLTGPSVRQLLAGEVLELARLDLQLDQVTDVVEATASAAAYLAHHWQLPAHLSDLPRGLPRPGAGVPVIYQRTGAGCEIRSPNGRMTARIDTDGAVQFLKQG